jgi:hypothetical protein
MIEAIAEHDPTADVVLRIARLARNGKLEEFEHVVRADPELDETTRAWVLELTADETVLLAAELYLERARQLN